MVFTPRPPPKHYKRKAKITKVPSSQKKFLQNVLQFSEEFKKKKIKYVAAIACHGISCDSAKHLLCQNPVTCEDPIFKTEYDVVFTSKYGDTTVVYGNNSKIGKYLYRNLREKNDPENFKGGEFMEILNSTIDRKPVAISDDHEEGIGGALGKNTILTQKDAGTFISDLDIFVQGNHSKPITHTNNDNDSVFLFKVDGDGDDDDVFDDGWFDDDTIEKAFANVQDHNVLAVDPYDLYKRRRALRYVAQTSLNLQQFIEPTHAGLEPTSDKHVFWSDITHRLKGGNGVRLSDILGKKNIFPEGTVVVAYVCRSTLVPTFCGYSPTAGDYTPASHAQTTPRPGFGSFALETPVATPTAMPQTPSGLSWVGTPTGSATPTAMSGSSEIGFGSADLAGIPEYSEWVELGTPTGTPTRTPTGLSWFGTPRSNFSLFETPTGHQSVPGTPKSYESEPFDPDDPSWMSNGGAMTKRKNRKSIKKRKLINFINVPRSRTRTRTRT